MWSHGGARQVRDATVGVVRPRAVLARGASELGEWVASWSLERLNGSARARLRAEVTAGCDDALYHLARARAEAALGRHACP